MPQHKARLVPSAVAVSLVGAIACAILGIGTNGLPFVLCPSVETRTHRSPTAMCSTRRPSPRSDETDTRFAKRAFLMGLGCIGCVACSGKAQALQKSFISEEDLYDLIKSFGSEKNEAGYVNKLYDPTANDQGAPEKHTPVAKPDGGNLVLTIPKAVQDPVKPHFIQYGWFRDARSGEIVGARRFKSTSIDSPVLEFAAEKGKVYVPCVVCNIHGRWEGEPVEMK